MRRELNEIEYFNWCFGQPNNIVVVVQLRGDLGPDRLRAALDKAQQRHPLLGVNTEMAPGGLPWFSSEGVGPIPLSVVADTDPEAPRTHVQAELVSTFAMNEPGTARPPLIRVAMFLPGDPARPVEVVFTVQHVIGDGQSMLFLVRDLLRFLEEPDAPVEVLDAPASPEDLLPTWVRRWTPRSPLRFKVALWLTRLYVWLRFGSRPVPKREHQQHHRSWELTQDQTSRLRARCRRESVSVHSAICTAFLPGFGAVHTPVSLRGALARPVDESFGLFVGAATVKMPYRPARGFWDNARRFHRRLRRAQRDPFSIFRLFSKAVPLDLFHRLGPLMVRLTSERPFAVTNLGPLDGRGVQLQGKNLKIESFYGAMSSIVQASALLVYTIDGRLRMHLLASESPPAPTAIRDDSERAVRRLLEAIEDER